MAEQQDFQVFLTKEDYDQLNQWKDKYHLLEKEHTRTKKELDQIKETLIMQKKCTFIKNQEVNYLVGEINFLCDSITGSSQLQLMDISKSYYQDLVDLKAEGLSGIMQQEILDSFKDTHNKTLFRITEVEKKFASLQTQLKQITALFADSTKQENKQPASPQKKKNNSKLDEQIIADLMKEKSTLENKLRLIQKDFDELIDQNLQFQKQIQTLKSKRQNSDGGQKSYRIKLLIDEYYKQLEINLGELGGLERADIETVVSNQLKGIVDYINNLMKKTFVGKKNK